jgi:hypothetical protein
VVALNLVDLLTNTNLKDEFVETCSANGHNVRGGLSTVVASDEFVYDADEWSYSYEYVEPEAVTWDFSVSDGFTNSNAAPGTIMSEDVEIFDMRFELDITVNVHQVEGVLMDSYAYTKVCGVFTEPAPAKSSH